MKYGITVNVLAPGALSRMTEDLMPDTPELAERMAPEKVAPTVVWLCTDGRGGVWEAVNLGIHHNQRIELEEAR